MEARSEKTPSSGLLLVPMATGSPEQQQSQTVINASGRASPKSREQTGILFLVSADGEGWSFLGDGGEEATAIKAAPFIRR